MQTFPEFSTLRIDVDAAVATLWLARPESRNALNVAMCQELVEACDALEQADTVRVIVVRGEGVAFCAGADLKEAACGCAGCYTAYAAIEALSKPVIAAIQGPAYGSGCEIAAACDFVLADTSAAFKYPEVGWGTVGATQRLPRIVGRRMAKELLFTGRVVDAQEALQLGMVNHVFSSDAFDAQHIVRHWPAHLALQIAAAHPLTVALTKHSIDAGLDTTREGAMAVELLAIQENLRRSDWKKAIAGFGKKGDGDAAAQ